MVQTLFRVDKTADVLLFHLSAFFTYSINYTKIQIVTYNLSKPIHKRNTILEASCKCQSISRFWSSLI